MKKIILKCKRYKEIDDCKESVCLHGWLMEIISDQFAEELHQTGTNPLSLQTMRPFRSFLICSMKKLAAKSSR